MFENEFKPLTFEKGWNYISGVPETEDQQRLRFQIELEFVQCLGNPNYLNCKRPNLKNNWRHLTSFVFVLAVLAQRGYFKDSTFVNYLKYLLYWKEPEYAKYLKYPMCLYFLDLLQYEHFRRELVNAQCTKFIDDQQILLWQHYTRRRSRLLQTTSTNGNSDVNVGNQNSAQTNGHMTQKVI